MQGNGAEEKVSREFSFAIVIPQKNAEMSAEQISAINQATNVVVNRKGRLDWATIKQIGLPILLSLLPP
jgi:hypothetical protein